METACELSTYEPAAGAGVGRSRRRWSASSARATWRCWSSRARGDGAAASDVDTSARGFGAIWEAVRGATSTSAIDWPTLPISINDMGATPAVVSLRLDQAVAETHARDRP